MDLVLFRGRKLDARILPKARRWLAGHQDIVVTSGYRSERHNRAIGGSPTSHHLRGRALDVVGPKATLDHLQMSAPLYGAVEVLRESDHLHAAF